MQPTSIQQYYARKTILITGGTGFLGSYLVEKLLRSCPEIRTIYLLIRSKSHKNSNSRLEEFLDNKIYTCLKESNPNVLEKLAVITGDLQHPEMGLTEEDVAKIINEVNCIFHVAATVKFTEALQRAILINIVGTNGLIEIAKRMKHLQSFVHFSTAFSQCIRNQTEETFYTCTENYQELIAMANTLSVEKLNEMTPTILGKYPNTYTFTKSITEDLIRRKGTNLPMAIVRPSIVIAPYQEPETGWSSSFDLTSLLMAAVNLGIVHTLPCNPKAIVDLVPVDFCVNQAIAVGWAIGKNWSVMSTVPIYNLVSGPRNPITWGLQKKVMEKSESAIPSNKKILHRFVVYSTNKDLLRVIDLLYLPLMYMVNLRYYFHGKVHSLLKMYRKLKEFCKVVEFVSCKEWYFTDNNTQNLWNLLQEEDRKIFYFDINLIDWQLCAYNITSGVRQYIIKDDFSTLEVARKRTFALMILHYIVIFVFLLLFMYILYTFFTILL